MTLLTQLGETDQADIASNRLQLQKMIALGELAGGITHDFRNILQTVISTLDVIESRCNDPAEVRRLAASALKASERGIGLTQRLLRFARHDPIKVGPANLLVSLESATETLSRTVEARINVHIEKPRADLWQVAIDPNEFELALINLGINARDAMPKGGRIRLTACNVTIPHVDRRASRSATEFAPSNRRGSCLRLQGGDYVAVTVGDTGSGMDPATLARAVEPFFTTKPAGKGTGLGLATVYNLVTQARGTVRMRSEPGHGTTIELWLPRAPLPIDATSTVVGEAPDEAFDDVRAEAARNDTELRRLAAAQRLPA